MPLIFCEKGTTNAVLGGKIKGGKIKVLNFGGGIASNVVTPKCRLTVEGDISVKAADGITFEKSDGKTVVEAVGLGAHGSTPHLGINAAVRLLNAVKANDFGGTFGNIMNFILKYLGGETTGEKLGIHYFDGETGETTVNLGVLKTDGEELSFTLDIRYPKNADTENVKKQLENKAQKYDLEVLKLKPGSYSVRSEELGACK